MSAPDIAALRRLLAAATPGEWRAVLEHAEQPVCYYRALIGLAANKAGTGYVSVVGPDHEHAVYKVAENAALIAAAVNALPALLDEVERLRATNRRYRIGMRECVKAKADGRDIQWIDDTLRDLLAGATPPPESLEAQLAAVTAERDALEAALRPLLLAADELVSWDWPKLLVDGPDSETATRDAAALEAQLPRARAALAKVSP